MQVVATGSFVFHASAPGLCCAAASQPWITFTGFQFNWVSETPICRQHNENSNLYILDDWGFTISCKEENRRWEQIVVDVRKPPHSFEMPCFRHLRCQAQIFWTHFSFRLIYRPHIITIQNRRFRQFQEDFTLIPGNLFRCFLKGHEKGILFGFGTQHWKLMHRHSESHHQPILQN